MRTKPKSKSISILLTILLTVLFVIPSEGWAEDNNAPGKPSGLMVNFLKQPIGIEDLNPKFSWIVNDLDANEVQTAFQILVSSNLENLENNIGDVWDSGKVMSSQSSNVEYQGDNLEYQSVYYWKVRTWDKHDQVSEYSDTQMFVTGVGDNWQAKPIWCEKYELDSIWQDYTIEADFTVISNAASVYLRAKDHNNNYLWQLNYSGGNPILKTHIIQNGKPVVLKEVPISDIIPASEFLNKQHHLKIEVYGDQIKTYINNQLIDTQVDSTFVSGLIGFRNGSSEQCLFDNVKVYNEDGIIFEDDLSDPDNPNFTGGTIQDGKLFIDKGEKVLYKDNNLKLNNFVFLRKSFVLPDKEIDKAIAYVTAHSPERAKQYVYKLYVNGEFVGVGPERAFDSIVKYNSYDITNILNEGAENVIGALNYTKDDKRFLMQVKIFYKDGTTDIICTDSTWKALDGTDVFPDMGNIGGTYDAPREFINANEYPFGWNEPGFDDSEWSNVEEKEQFDNLVASYTHNMNRHLVEPVEIIDKGDNCYFVDFGKEVIGGIVLDIIGKQGDQVEIRLGEELSAPNTVRYKLRTGNIYQETWILKEGPQVIENWGYRCFRYVEIVNCPVELKKENIKAAVLLYPFDEEQSYFNSSDDTLNDVWDLCKYSIKATAFDLYVDSHTRERLPYEGDAYINQLSHYSVDREFALPRYSLEYLINNPTWPTEYKQISVMMAWEDYMHTGNKELLEKYYEALKDKVLDDYINEEGLIQKTTKNDLVDWPASQRDGYEFTEINTVINAFNYKAMNDLSKIADLLGKQADAEYYEEKASKMCTAINELLYDSDIGAFKDGKDSDHHSTHASAFPTAFSCINDEYIEDIGRFLESRGMRVSVYGSQFLLQALYNINRDQAALKLLNSKTGNSWGHMIYDLGATIVTEAWDPSQKPNMTFSHAWASAPANIIPRGMFGIVPLEPGYEYFQVKPQLGGLEYANLKIPTIKGNISTECSYINGDFHMNLTIPANTKAKVYIPMGNISHDLVEVDGQITRGEIENGFIVLDNIGSGTHSFSRPKGVSLELYIDKEGTLFVGDTVQLLLRAVQDDGNEIDILDTQIEYNIDNPYVASIDNDGVITIKEEGTANITCMVTLTDICIGEVELDELVVESSINISTKEPVVKDLEISVDANKLFVNDSLNAILHGTLENDKPINWDRVVVDYHSSDNSIAEVNEQGTITALRPGNVDIIAEVKSGIIYNDDFSDNEHNNFSSGTIKDGKLYLDKGQKAELIKGINYDDFIFETDLDIIENAASICFRMQDFNNMYLWQLGYLHGNPPEPGDPILKTHVIQNGKVTILDEIPIHHIIPEEDFLTKTHHIRVEVKGNRIKTYINGILVNDITDDTFASGNIGFRNGSSEISQYDNVLVYSSSIQDCVQIAIKDRNCVLKNIKINGQDLNEFDPFNNEYFIKFMPWDVELPYVSVQTINPDAYVQIQDADGIPGTTTIRVVSPDGISEEIYKIHFEVEQQEIERVNIEVEKNVIERTENLLINTQVKFKNIDEFISIDKLPDAQIEYISSDPSIVSIDENGKLVANKVGSADISAIVKYDGKVFESNTITVAVKELSMDDVSLDMSIQPEIVGIGEQSNIILKAQNAKDLYAFDIVLNYDPTMFELKQVKLSDQFGIDDNTAELQYIDQDGKLHLIGTLLGDVDGVTGEDIELVDVVFVAKQKEGLSRFVIENGSALSDKTAALYELDEDIGYTKPVANADVTGGGIAINDLVIVARAFGKTDKDIGYEARLDMNKDGVIDIMDIAYVAKKVLNK